MPSHHAIRRFHHAADDMFSFFADAAFDFSPLPSPAIVNAAWFYTFIKNLMPF